MASKAMYETAQPVERTESIIVEIEGLRSNSDGSFTLDGVKPVDIDYGLVDKILMDAGVPKTIMQVQVENFANELETALIADALARRTKRIG